MQNWTGVNGVLEIDAEETLVKCFFEIDNDHTINYISSRARIEPNSVAQIFSLRAMLSPERGAPGLPQPSRRKRGEYYLTRASTLAASTILFRIPLAIHPRLFSTRAVARWTSTPGRLKVCPTLLAMRRYSHLPAVLEKGAGGALGAFTRADVFSKRHEQAVDFDPVFPWQNRHERCRGLFRCGGGDVSPTVCHAVHMDIDADVRLTACDPEDKVRAFDSNTMEREQHVEVTRKRAAELILDPLGNRVDLTRFCFMKGAIVDQCIDLVWRKRG